MTLDEYEALVAADDAPAVLLVDRALQRALFERLRQAERECETWRVYARELEREGYFW